MSDPTTTAPARPGTRKVTMGALGGAAATVIIWLIHTVTDVTVPGEVAGAIATLATAFFVYVVREP